MARRAYVVSEQAGNWAVECDGICLMQTQHRDQAVHMARAAAHRAFMAGSASAVLLKSHDGQLATEWLFGFDDELTA